MSLFKESKEAIRAKIEDLQFKKVPLVQQIKDLVQQKQDLSAQRDAIQLQIDNLQNDLNNG